MILKLEKMQSYDAYDRSKKMKHQSWQEFQKSSKSAFLFDGWGNMKLKMIKLSFHLDMCFLPYDNAFHF